MTRDRIFFFVTALLAAIFLTMLVELARAEQRIIYGSDGRVIGRTITDSQGTRTLYGSDGKAITRESPTTGGSTTYDARSGNAIGKITKDRK